MRREELRERAIARAAARAEMASAMAAEAAAAQGLGPVSGGESAAAIASAEQAALAGAPVPLFRRGGIHAPRPSPAVWRTPDYQRLWSMALQVGAAQEQQQQQQGEREQEDEQQQQAPQRATMGNDEAALQALAGAASAGLLQMQAPQRVGGAAAAAHPAQGSAAPSSAHPGAPEPASSSPLLSDIPVRVTTVEAPARPGPSAQRHSLTRDSAASVLASPPPRGGPDSTSSPLPTVGLLGSFDLLGNPAAPDEAQSIADSAMGFGRRMARGAMHHDADLDSARSRTEELGLTDLDSARGGHLARVGELGDIDSARGSYSRGGSSRAEESDDEAAGEGAAGEGPVGEEEVQLEVRGQAEDGEEGENEGEDARVREAARRHASEQGWEEEDLFARYSVTSYGQQQAPHVGQGQQQQRLHQRRSAGGGSPRRLGAAGAGGGGLPSPLRRSSNFNQFSEESGAQAEMGEAGSHGTAAQEQQVQDRAPASPLGLARHVLPSRDDSARDLPSMFTDEGGAARADSAGLAVGGEGEEGQGAGPLREGADGARVPRRSSGNAPRRSDSANGRVGREGRLGTECALVLLFALCAEVIGSREY